MSRTLRIRPTGAAAVIGIMIGAVALTGCGAGQITQTSSQVSGVDGASSTSGSIAIRDAEIEFPADATLAGSYPIGSSAALALSIVNTGGVSDKLVSVSSPVAASVQLSGAAEIPGGLVVLVAGKPAAAAVTPSATATPGASSTPTPTAVPTAAPTTSAAPAAGSERKAQIVLTGLRQPVQAGKAYQIVFTFERAGQLTANVPVGNPQEAAHS